MRIGTVNGEHSTLILSFGVFALNPGLPQCDYFMSNIINNIKQQKLWDSTTKSDVRKENLNHSIVYMVYSKLSPYYGLGGILPIIRNAMFFILHLQSYSQTLLI